MRHHGKEGSLHTKIGYNWRMSEINAILGIYQLRRLDEFLVKRNHVANRYAQELNDLKNLTLISVPSNIRHSFWKYPTLYA